MVTVTDAHVALCGRHLSWPRGPAPSRFFGEEDDGPSGRPRPPSCILPTAWVHTLQSLRSAVHLAPCFVELVEPFWLRAHFPWLPVSESGERKWAKMEEEEADEGDPGEAVWEVPVMEVAQGAPSIVPPSSHQSPLVDNRRSSR